MANTAHTSEEEMLEIYDSPEELESKIQKLATMVKNSKHLVTFTGAGISTSAGIHDFRGPTGKWTRQAKGLDPLKGTPTISAYPTPTHMSFVKLAEEGVLKYHISQNCDGLNVRSGFPQNQLSELHGNGNIEICEDCGQKYFRDMKIGKRTFKTGMQRDRWTGRWCNHPECTGRLLKSTICFGQQLPPEPLRLAEEHSAKADLHIALGSSLRVTPAATCCEDTVNSGGKLVIVNLQKTPLTRIAEFQIYAKIDDVMIRLMELLGYEIPEFRLKRKVVCGVEPNGKGLYVRGAALTDETLEHDFIRCATWGKPEIRRRDSRITGRVGSMEHAGQKIDSKIYDNKFSGFDMQKNTIKKKDADKVVAANRRVFVDVELVCGGHYGEPYLTLSNDFTQAYRIDQRVEYVWDIEFNPYTKQWKAEARLSTVPAKTAHVIDNSFGELCKQYATDYLVKKGFTKKQANVKWEAHIRKWRKKE